MATVDDKRSAAQQRAAELKAKAAREEKRRRVIAVVVTVVVALGAIGAIVALAVSRGGDENAPAAEGPELPEPNTGMPPWALPENTEAAVEKAGLEILGREYFDYHPHTYLEIVNHGEPVQVPANIGIDVNARALSALHTHTDDGTIHVEAAEEGVFTIGQLFAEWNVRLTEDCVGGLCADEDNDLLFFVNGEPYDGDPNDIRIENHKDVSIAYVEAGADFEPTRRDWDAWEGTQ